MKFINGTFKQLIKDQDELYEKMVLPVLGEPSYENVYKEYINKLEHFNARSFKTVIERISNSDIVIEFIDLFNYIPQYISARNNFDQKRKNILTMEGTPHEKQSIFDSLDRERTRAHNGVILLFNKLNKYAVQNNIAEPFPYGFEFDKTNLNDRHIVAETLSKTEPVMSLVNHFINEQKTEQETEEEQLKKMTLKEQLNYVLSK